MSKLEKLAALEHEQWAHWTKYMLDNLTPENIERWRRQIDTPYEQLSEEEKESDREWARKVFSALTTSDLSAELMTREGVQKFEVLPDEHFILKIFNGEKHMRFEGPAIILINQD